MSCNYADGLSPYENKGVLGLPEKFETDEKFNKKCDLLAQYISGAEHVVVHTGAGISTSAGIPDFRGPNGVWTLEKQGKRPTTNVSFAEAKPTKTHMILKKLIECNKIHYIVSQNIDGLHLKSGLPRKYISELHGNMFVEECNVCKNQFVRSSPVETVGKKSSGVPCATGFSTRRPCRGKLHDGVLDWEHSLPENDLLMAEYHSSIADLSVCLGTTLQIVPSGNLPLETVKYGGKLVICNLQPTKHDNKADLIINSYVDNVMERVMNILGIDVPDYNEEDNTSLLAKETTIPWTIDRNDLLAAERKYKAKCKGVKKTRNLVKNKKEPKDDAECSKSKIKREDFKAEINGDSEVNGKTEEGYSFNGEIDTVKLEPIKDEQIDEEGRTSLNLTEVKVDIEEENRDSTLDVNNVRIRNEEQNELIANVCHTTINSKTCKYDQRTLHNHQSQMFRQMKAPL